ncbi:hypothetical protein DVH24_036377 [Malus domestica]|uniref:ADP-ribosyl cyclase/cyclic ADP-ribose hydrolase n=1 Tax=Malus domestica TaxID=3750 RepID=A0A498IFA5_MALDO|nr:hypothetical protein DVH24_036377 [Malus domestica]
MALVRAAQGTSSDSNTRRGYRYDVFLSFRGEDTRRNFTDHLYTALNNAGYLTFRDNDELERGEDIKPGLQKAIRLSRTSVVVFSKYYASSKWCLDELAMILERKRTTSDHVVLPVFYDVDPSHVRKQTGSIGKAFARHEKTQLPNTVKRWREALAEVADLAGMVLPNEADGCNLSDDAFAMDLSNLSSLQILYLDHNPISSLPVFIKGLTKLWILSFNDCERLESLVGLPKITHMDVYGCISLKQITYQSYGLRALTYEGENHNLLECEFYDNLEQIERVDVEMRKLLSLHNLEMRKLFSLQNFKQVDWVWSPVQGLDRHGIYSTFFYGNEVPGRFSYKSTKSSISFIVPSLSSHKIQGLNIFATYVNELKWIYSLFDPFMSIEVSNKSKGMKWTYGPRFCGHCGFGEDVTWLSHWKMDNETIILECGDEVVVSVRTRRLYIQVKEFGVELVQEHQDQMSTQHNTTPDPNDPFVIGGDLSPLEHISGLYDFCWFREAEMKNVDFCRPKWLNTLIMDSDKEEEQQNDLDHKIAAASARGNNCHLRGWRGLVTAAIFLLTLTLIDLHLSKKEATVVQKPSTSVLFY